MGFSAEKLLILKYGFHLKRSTEKSQAVLRGSFQSRRMGAKLKSKDGSDFVGTLNGSGLAVGE